MKKAVEMSKEEDARLSVEYHDRLAARAAARRKAALREESIKKFEERCQQKRRQQRVLPRWTLSGQPPAQPAAHCAQPSCTDDAQSVLFAQVLWSVRLVAFWSCLHFSLFARKIVEMRVLAGGAIE